jgi:hypothetical protein
MSRVRVSSPALCKAFAGHRRSTRHLLAPAFWTRMIRFRLVLSKGILIVKSECSIHMLGDGKLVFLENPVTSTPRSIRFSHKLHDWKPRGSPSAYREPQAGDEASDRCGFDGWHARSRWQLTRKGPPRCTTDDLVSAASSLHGRKAAKRLPPTFETISVDRLTNADRKSSLS